MTSLDGIRRFAEFAREDGYTNRQIAEAVGIAVPGPVLKWTPDLAVTAARAFAAAEGRWPLSREGGGKRLPAHQTARRLFGTWSSFMRAAA